ncbi:DMT family transporter [Pseudochelatococcus contaminans]|uniref:DME family drug/metabolite transporter n=1 Tax=Pseudochelatococcus contaminans TaxID=1538103 RepID=A0A7W6EGL2_9HYPH|nr:EamA family transporter [Pseudochelatococcus contaminans]MBB3809554.1 DME family drug/metabolite transporter [Pseudochelatococcus contaminans]
MQRSSQIGGICVLIASVLWGTTGTTATFATGVSPLGIGAVTMGLGGIILCLTALGPMLKHGHIIAKRWRLLALGAVAVAIYPLTFYSSMHYAGVAIGSVVSLGSAPLAASLIEWLFDGQRLTLRWLLGVIVGLAGATLLCLGEASTAAATSGTESADTFYGIILGVGAGLSYAYYSWIARRLMLSGLPSRATMGAMFGSGGVLLLPVLLLTGAPLMASWSNVAVGLYMVLVPMVIAYLLFGYGLASISATMATTLTLLEPVVAAILAVLIVGERLPAQGWTGIGLIVGSLLILTVPAFRFRNAKNAARVSDNHPSSVTQPSSGS